MKKGFSLLLALLLLAVPMLGIADISELPTERLMPLLVDEGNLLTDEEEIAFLAELERISSEQKCDVAVVIPRTLGGKSATAFADDYYDLNGYGYGSTKDGILLMVCMEERDYATSTAGAAQDWFDDATLYNIENAFVPLLSEGKYLEAFETFATRCERVLNNVDRREVLYLDDVAGFLNETDRNVVLRTLESNSHVAGICDIVVLTVPSLGGQSASEYASGLFSSGVYRHGSGYDKVALVVDRDAGMCYCVTDSTANRYFTADNCASLEQDAATMLSNGDAAGAFRQFASSAYRIISAFNGQNGSPTVERHGVQIFSFFRFVIAAFVGLIVTLNVTNALKNQLKSVKTQSEAANYFVQNSLHLTESQDLYLARHVTSTPRVTETRSGGGGGHSGGSHFSSSGISHGGHSGKF